jgi:RNA polymerase sigma-70 factor (ECF subfamily)
VSHSSEQALRANATLGLAVRAKTAAASTEDLVTNLFQQFREPLFRYILLLTWNPGEGEEIVQEVFLKLYRELLDSKSIDNLRAWLFSVGHNLAIDRRRAARESSSLSELTVARSVEGLLSPAVPTPESVLLRKEQHATLARTVAALPDLQRHCLFLRKEGFRYREIAAVLGIGETTVVDNIGRAVARLHRELHVSPSK